MKKAFNLKKALICVLVLVLCVAMFVACDKNKGDQYDMTNLNNALSYVRKWADTHIPTSTTASFDLIATTLDTNGTKYDVTWTLAIKTEGVAADAITLGAVDTETNTVKVTVPDRAEQDIEFTLTATISADDHSVTRDWSIKVLKWELNTWQQYYEAKAGDSVTVQGVVTLVNSKKNGSKYNSLYAQNADGAFYVYSMTDDPADLGIQVGMTVEMSGTKDIYNGTHELTNTAVTVVDTNVTTVEPKDITELLKAATSTEDDALVKLQGMLVKFDGAMVLEVGDSNYCYFSLGTLKAYVRPSSSSTPMSDADVTAFMAAWGENNAHVVNISNAQATVYSGKFYVQPLASDSATFGDLASMTPAQELEFTQNNTSITTEIFANGTETLPLVGATFADVKIAWASSDATKAAIDAATGKVTYTYTYTDEPQTVTLTATFTHAKDATLSETGTYTVNLNKPTAVTVEEFLAKEEDSTVYALTGFIAAANKKAGEAGAFVLLDSTGAVFSFNTADVTVGDKVTVYATRTSNYGVPQLGTVSVTKLAAETYTEPTPEDLDGTTIDLSALSKDTIGDMTGKYYKISGLKLYKNGTYNSAGTLKDGSTTEYDQVLSLYGYSDLFDEDLFGQDVFVYGYVRGCSTGKYLTIQVVKVTTTLTDEQIVEAAHTALELSNTQFGANFTLPTEAANGVTISWASNNTAVVTIDGANATVTPPAADTQVKLTATLTKGSASQTKDFTVTITANVTQYKVSWTDTALTVKNGETALASEDKVDEGTTVTVTVAVPANKVLASFQVNGGTADTSVAYGTTFTVTVTSDTAIVVNYTDVTPVTVAEFLTKSVDTTTVYAITGFVSAQGAASGTEASFVISDSTGAVFSYAKFDVTVGEKVIVYANRAVNYGVPQLGTLHITKLAAETYTEPTATELDGATLDLSTLSSDTIGTMTGKYYKITGLKMYKNGDYTSAGTGSTGAYTQKLSLYGYDDLFDEALLDQEVVVYGYVRGCKTNSYLTIQVVKVTGVSDADKVAAAKEALTLTSDKYADSFTLPLTGANDTTISWAVKGTSTVLAIEGANATVTKPSVDTSVTIVATITKGEASATKEFALTITATIPQFEVTITDPAVTGASITVKNGDATVATGTSVDQGTVLTITVVVPDTHTLSAVTANSTALTAGTDGTYTYTVENATTIALELTKVLTQEEIVLAAYELGSYSNNSGPKLSDGPYTLTGKVTEIKEAYSTQYSNISVWIVVGDLTEKPFLCYHMKGEGADQIMINDIITVTGDEIVNYYGNTVEFNSSCTLTSRTVGTSTVGVDNASSANATVVIEDNMTSGLNGSTFTFTVSAASGHEITSVKVNGVPVTADDNGTYTGTINGNVTILVETREEGASDPVVVATFTFPTSSSTSSHQDGSEISTYTDTQGDYTLTLSSLTKVYSKANDAKGNGALKLGTGSAAGSFTIAVPTGVKKVAIYVAGYKAKTTGVTVGSTTYTLQTTSLSNNGEYEAITVDVSSIDSLTFTSGASGDKRCMINKIEFLA